MGSDVGWYPDPDREGWARYWDGSSWTDRTQRLEVGDGGNAAEQPSDRRQWWMAAAAVVGVVVLVVAGVLVFTGDEADATEVILEPAGSDGVDPFMDSIASEAVDPDGIESGGVQQVAAGGEEIEALSGATPGLYGGTGEDEVCDAAALVEFLDGDAAKAEAFASVQGIDPDGVGEFVAGLTPLLLREDTRVTNHGFADGEATPVQSVLQAGTAVLVDQRGVPRVRCSCGNPLLEPAAAADAQFVGSPWDGFDDNRLITVSAADQDLEAFEVVDVDTGETLDVAAGTDGAAGGTLTVDDLLGVTLPGEGCDGSEGVTLVDGYFMCEGDAGPGDIRSIWIVGKNPGLPGEPLVALGDVTGDGISEGVIVTLANAGGTATAAVGYVIAEGGEVLAPLPEVPSSPMSLDLVDGLIEIGGLEYGPDDPNCCPSVPATARYEWDGTAVVPAP